MGKSVSVYVCFVHKNEEELFSFSSGGVSSIFPLDLQLGIKKGSSRYGKEAI